MNLVIYHYDLKKAGLHRLNISLHSLDKKLYKYITGIDALEKVLSNIEEAAHVGFKQVKIDFLVMSINVHEITRLINFARKLQVDLQLIELIPIGKAESIFKKYHVDIYQVFKRIKTKYNVNSISIRQDLHYRPIIEIDGVKIEFVKGYCNPLFCRNCRQLRLSPDGIFYTCIYGGLKINVLELIKSRNEAELVEKLKKICTLRKPKFHITENT